MVAIIDYELGNLASVKKALDYLKIENVITSNLNEIKQSSSIILPGVGSFPEGMKRLNKIKAKEKILEFVKKKKLLGICLGMQLLLEEGEEIKLTKGLGLIPGKVVRFPKNIRAHVGWSKVSIDKKINL